VVLAAIEMGSELFAARAESKKRGTGAQS